MAAEGMKNVVIFVTMKTKILRSFFKTLVMVVVAAAAVVSCGRNGGSAKKRSEITSEQPSQKRHRKARQTAIGLAKPDTCRYYRLAADSLDCFFLVDSYDEDGNASGHYYLIKEAEAERCRFSATFGKRHVTVTAGGREIKLDNKSVRYSPYEEPAFAPGNLKIYRRDYCDTKVTNDIEYGKVQGYWTALEGAEKEIAKVFTQGYVKSFKKRDLDLTLDLYQPEKRNGLRPLILFIHGGAFYIGNKEEPAYVDFCQYYAGMGYVTASINYRLGFHLSKNEIERAGYVALQDAHAALRFLCAHAKEYGIDRNRIFLAGSSAGAITALNLAFMNEEDRPTSTLGRKAFLKNVTDLGGIDSSGNNLKADFKIIALANMWGAVSDLDLLENNKTSIVSFHGEDDKVVPYAEGYPLASAGEGIARMLGEVMYGSACIDKKADSLGLRHKFYSFPGEGHAFNTTPKEKQPNENHYIIRDRITEFFFNELAPGKAVIKAGTPGIYSIEGAEVKDVQWKVEGGFVVANPDAKTVRVLWCADQPHAIRATGNYGNEISWMAEL